MRLKKGIRKKIVKIAPYTIKKARNDGLFIFHSFKISQSSGQNPLKDQ